MQSGPAAGERPKTAVKALVLSAGGMYGAYQAGAWKALAGVFRPDLVVGASVGALNGWAIAGGCDPDELIRLWLNLDCAARYRWKLPRTIWGGFLDTEPLERAIQGVYQSYQLKTDFAVVLTVLRKLRPRIFRSSEVSWRHLAATISILGLFDPVTIAGCAYSDGGLLSAVPLWAAAQLGATEALVIDAMPETPGWIAKTVVGAVRAFSSFRPVVPAGLNVVRLGPAGLLGRPLEAIYWKRQNAERWIGAGEQDAGAMKHSIASCFERQ